MQKYYTSIFTDRKSYGLSPYNVAHKNMKHGNNEQNKT